MQNEPTASNGYAVSANSTALGSRLHGGRDVHLRHRRHQRARLRSERHPHHLLRVRHSRRRHVDLESVRAEIEQSALDTKISETYEATVTPVGSPSTIPSTTSTACKSEGRDAKGDAVPLGIPLPKGLRPFGIPLRAMRMRIAWGRMGGLRFDSGANPAGRRRDSLFFMGVWDEGLSACVWVICVVRRGGRGPLSPRRPAWRWTAVCCAAFRGRIPAAAKPCAHGIIHPAARIAWGKDGRLAFRFGANPAGRRRDSLFFNGRMGRGFVCVCLGYLRCASWGKGSPLAAPTSVALTAVCCAHSGEGFPLLQTMCPRYHPPGGAHRVGEGWTACVSIRGESRRTAAGFAVFYGRMGRGFVCVCLGYLRRASRGGRGSPSRRADRRGVDGCLRRAFRGRIPAAANHVPTVSSARRRASRGGRMDGLRFDSGRIPPDGGGIRCLFLWGVWGEGFVCVRLGYLRCASRGKGSPLARADQAWR